MKLTEQNEVFRLRLIYRRGNWNRTLAQTAGQIRYDTRPTTIESGSVSVSSIASLQRNMAQRLPDLTKSNFRVFSVIAILL
jgi:hypothetical protein